MSTASALSTIYLGVTLMVGLVLHEYAHALMAVRLGDQTPRQTGRLTLNPRPHLDPFGSLLLPGILLLPVLFGRGFVFPVFAYARPMELNPWTLRRRDRDATLIALAGPAANVVLAFAFGALIRLAPGSGEVPRLLEAGLITSVVLAVMNVIPIPGLDASRIVARFLSLRAREVYSNLDQYCALFILVVVFIFQGPVVAFVRAIGNGVCQLAQGGPCL